MPAGDRRKNTINTKRRLLDFLRTEAIAVATVVWRLWHFVANFTKNDSCRKVKHEQPDLYLKDPLNKDSRDSLLEKLELLDILLPISIAKGRKPYGKEVSASLEGILKSRPTPSRIRASIDKLVREKLLSKSSDGLAIHDEAFAEYLLQMEFPVLA